MDTDRFLRLPEVVSMTGMGKTTVRKLESEGKFPKRKQLSPRRVGWKLSEVQAWMAERPAA